MQRYFVDRSQMADGCVYITGDDVKHIRSVLRMRPGDDIFVSCGDEWEYTCEITGITADMITARITDAQKPAKELASHIALFQCLPKGDKMELIIQKAVELGVHEIVPVSSRRCVVRLDERRSVSKIVRWNSISESAAKQSRRLIVPEVHSVVSFRDALKYSSGYDVRLIPYENEKGIAHTRELLSSIRSGQSVAVLIGPEGGFETGEVEEAVAAGFVPVTLGHRILRTETAGMAALAILMYLLERD